MNSIAKSSPVVNGYSAKCTNLALTSGEKVKRRKFAPAPPPAPILTISRNISLAMTLAEYEITPTAATLAKIGGAR